MGDTQTQGGPREGSRPPLERATRQCEVELLVSGIAIFAMVQLAGVMDEAIFRLRPRFSPDWTSLLMLLYVYGKGAAVLLAGTFAIHLLLRARWIALAGMHAIRPQGVDWSRMNLGPIARASEQRAMGTIPEAVARADRRATIVFTVGVMLASMLVVVFSVVALGIGLPMLLLDRLGVALDPSLVMLVALVAMLPFFAANLFDKARGARLPPRGRGARLLARIFAGYRRAGMSAASNPAFALLTSVQGQRRTAVTTILVVMGVTLAVLGGYKALRSDTPLGSYGEFPVAGDGVLEAAPSLYDDQRDPLRDAPTPFIGRAIAAGPYLRLVVPFEPERNTAAMRTRCPGAEGDARLACLAALHPVTLDGEAVAPGYVLAQDPRTDRPALLAMLDVRELPPGRHVLVVERPPRHRRDGTARDDDTGTRVSIPFWR